MVHRKGGVGKTTTTINLAAALADAGYKVLVADNDPIGNATSAMGVVRFDELEQADAYPNLGTFVLGLTPFNTVVRRVPPGYIFPDSGDDTGAGGVIDVLASHHDSLESVDVQLNKDTLESKLRLRRALSLANFGSFYDFILIDCSPSLGALVKNAMAAANWWLMPMLPERFSMETTNEMFDLAEFIQSTVNPDLQLLGVLVNQAKNTNVFRSAFAELSEAYGDLLFNTQIRDLAVLRQSQFEGRSALTYKGSRDAANDYRRLMFEVVARAGLTLTPRAQELLNLLNGENNAGPAPKRKTTTKK
jgi:chromosome partitioning protein